MTQEVWTTEQVCEVLHCKPRTLYAYVANGQIRRHKVGNRNLFFPADVLHFIGTDGKKPTPGRVGC